MRARILTIATFIGWGLACGGGPVDEGPLQAAAVKNDIPERVRPARGPSGSADVVAGRFMVKLAASAGGEVGDDGAIRTKRPALSEALGRAGRGGRQIHKDQKLSRRGADHLRLRQSFELESSMELSALQTELEAHDEVAWIEPLAVYRPLNAPNDPYYQHQWHMKLLDLAGAHGISTGDGVVVAVIDSGVTEGPDGFGGMLTGYDFVDGDRDATDDDAAKPGQQSHGTHVAGTIAQSTGNGQGVAGMAPDAKILPIRVMGHRPALGFSTATSAEVAEAIVWAVDNGAEVINMSLGTTQYSQAVSDACDYAYDAGVLVVAATGNDGYTDTIYYPAAYDSVVAVGAVGPDSSLAYYSNQGAGVEVVAPGGDMNVDLDGDGFTDGVLQETAGGGEFGYAWFQGTSMAAPHVSGLAALLKANGFDDVAVLRAAISQTAKDLGAPGRDAGYGYGLIDPVAALNYKGGAVAIDSGVNTQPVGPGRAVLSWTSASATGTALWGDDGSTFDDDEPVRVHQAVVRSKPGSRVTYTVQTDAGPQKVTVSFGRGDTMPTRGKVGKGSKGGKPSGTSTGRGRGGKRGR